MLSKKEKALAEKVMTGGGATGVSMTTDPTNAKATLPNSKQQGDPMQKAQNPANTPIDETDPENNTKPTGDFSDANRKSVAMKTGMNIKEELANMFGVDVSEEFIESASVLFEAAIAIKQNELEEKYEALQEEKIKAIRAELEENVDRYLSFAAKEWLTENEVAIENSLKNELTEEFIQGLKDLFEQHYIEIPSEKVDVLETLTNKVTELEEKLNESMISSIELNKELSKFKMKDVFNSVSEGLALSQVEKFRTIAENLEFDGCVDSFKSKLMVVKENYFSEKKNAPSSNIITENFEGEVSNEESKVPVEMKRYVSAISQTSKK